MVVVKISCGKCYDTIVFYQGINCPNHSKVIGLCNILILEYGIFYVMRRLTELNRLEKNIITSQIYYCIYLLIIQV